MDLQTELHPYKVHLYTYISLFVNLVLNSPASYWVLYSPSKFLYDFYPTDYYPVASAVLLLVGLAIVIRNRSWRGMAPGLVLNVVMLVWGVIDVYPLFTAEVSYQVLL